MTFGKRIGKPIRNERGFVWPILVVLYEAFMLVGWFIAKVIEKLSVGQSW